MTEQDTLNFNIIEGLVENHFSLDKESLLLFKKELNNKTIDPFYRERVFFGDDLRARIEIPSENYEEIDEGWNIFNKYFKTFIEMNNITYTNYINNKFEKGKQEFKLFKGIKSFYDKNEKLKYELFRGYCENSEFVINHYESTFKEITEEIGKVKIPSGNIELVVSFNFADWFLCSSGEKWHSCLAIDDCNCDAFWSGLPGLITDTNRCLIYVTDKNKKNVNDIITDKLMFRTFGVLTKEDIVAPLRYYPQASIPPRFINQLIPFPMKDKTSYEGSGDWECKNPVELLRYKNGYSSFIYQDGSGFKKITECGKKATIGSGNGNIHYFNEYNKKIEESIFSFNQGNLSSLINRKEEIIDYYSEYSCSCDNCNCGLNEDDTYYAEDSVYCESCYNENFCSCESCGNSMANDDSHYVENNGSYCERCFHDKFFYCEDCGEAFPINIANEHNNNFYCLKCFIEDFFICSECDESHEISPVEPITYKNEQVCKACLYNLMTDEEAEEKDKEIG